MKTKGQQKIISGEKFKQNFLPKNVDGINYTKIILKIIVDPKNFPMSYHLEPKFESTLEFNYCSKDNINLNQAYEIDGISIHFDCVLDNLVEDTHFAIREKHFSFDFENLKEKLGYVPDVTEYNDRLKSYLQDIVETVMKTQREGSLVNLDDTLVFSHLKKKISVA